MESIGWLHLTDLHRGMSSQSCLWPNIEQQFFSDLESIHAKCGPWDIIFWSGDLVQKGAPGEFNQFTNVTQRLYAKLKTLGSTPTLITIPGNHDLARPASNDRGVEIAKRWNEDPQVARDFWKRTGSELHSTIKKAFRPYVRWERNHPFPRSSTSIKGRIPGDCAVTLNVRGLKIGVLGLNSAFLQLTDGNFENKLAIGTEQVIALCGEHYTDWFQRHHFCILMTHHPPDWLSAAAQETLFSEIAVPGRFVAHVCGHLHQSAFQSKAIGGATSQRVWQGASLFGLETFGEGVERRHGYSAGRIQIAGEAGHIRLWPRLAQKHQARHWHFVQDISFTLESDDGTRPEDCPIIPIPGAQTAEKSLFRVLVLSTDADLQEARRSAVTHLRKSLGIEVDDSEQRPPLNCDLAVLIQGWRWEGGSVARRWLEAEPSKRIAFLVRDAADWPPHRLVEMSAYSDIEKLRSQIEPAHVFDRPEQVPELIGAVVTERLQQRTGNVTTGLRNFERTYLEFRIPVWRSGRTALSQPHLFDAADAKELYQPDLYTALHGTSIDWRAGDEGTPKKMSAKSKRKRDIQLGEHDRRVRLAKWITVPEINRIALIGAPGGGKTIFLTRIAAAIGSACLGRPVEFEPDLEVEKLRRENRLPIPVVIEATRIAQRDPSTINALFGAMQDEMASAGTHRPGFEEIEGGLQIGRYFLLIDALDEIADAKLRSSVLFLVKSIAGLYPETLCLLTTRSARYTGRLRFGPEFHSVEVAPLDPDQIEQLCANWARQRKRDEEYRSLLMSAVSSLADQVGSSHSDQALTENPLMLTAICMVFERYRSLPDDRGRLCELLIDDLCRSRRSEDSSRSWKLDEAGKKDLLQRIALSMQEEGAQTWPFDRAVEIALQLVPTTDATRRERARRYVDWAADHTGILRFQEASDDQEQIRFWHRLFREYLSANRLAQEDTTAGDKIDKLWKDGRLSDPFWEDVIRLLPRTLGTIEKARSLRERLENLAASNSPQRGRILGLSAAGIIENRDLFPDVSFHDLARSMARIYEEEGNNWTLSDRLLFLDAVGRLDTTDCDPRMHVEKWVELKSGGAFVIHHRELPKSVSFAYAWAPVTVHEYWKFVKSDAFSDSAVWKDAPDSVSKSMASLSSHIQGQMRHPNRPVTWVSLYGALAFCAWKTMGRSDGRFIRLPQTAEWRKLLTASQIDRELLDAKEWPSGEKALFNWRGAGIGYPTPVGAFPLKVSGATDVLGNVWEWLSPSKGEPYHTFDDHQNRSESFPVGGGAYNTSLNPPDKSIAVPPPEFTTNGYEAIGFRCVISDVELDLKAVLSRLRADRRPRAERK